MDYHSHNERVMNLRAKGYSAYEARHIVLQESMTEALAKAEIDENLRWVIQQLIDHMPRTASTIT